MLPRAYVTIARFAQRKHFSIKPYLRLIPAIGTWMFGSIGVVSRVDLLCWQGYDIDWNRVGSDVS